MKTNKRERHLRMLPVAILVFFLGALPLTGQERPVRFAIVGDIDPEGSRTKAVATLIENYTPDSSTPGESKGVDFIIAVGDLNYEKDAAVYQEVAKVFPAYVRAPKDEPKPEELRFFPVLGNHEYRYEGDGFYDPARFQTYEKTFAVPPGEGGVHYYDFRRGPVHFFALDSNHIVTLDRSRKVVWDGTKLESKQEKWFRARLEEVKKDPAARWKIAFFHQPVAHSSSHHASETKRMKPWNLHHSGLSAVLTGHIHFYERLDFDGVPFFIAGTGGAGFYPFWKDKEKYAPESRSRYPDPIPSPLKPEHFGALFCEATSDALRFEFRTTTNKVIDRWSTP